jgi:uncharacterized protein (UPF0297 family)
MSDTSNTLSGDIPVNSTACEVNSESITTKYVLSVVYKFINDVEFNPVLSAVGFIFSIKSIS